MYCTDQSPLNRLEQPLRLGVKQDLVDLDVKVLAAGEYDARVAATVRAGGLYAKGWLDP